ncbi:hypothetical protein D3C81_1725410 [compost metagenome]
MRLVKAAIRVDGTRGGRHPLKDAVLQRPGAADCSHHQVQAGKLEQRRFVVQRPVQQNVCRLSSEQDIHATDLIVFDRARLTPEGQRHQHQCWQLRVKVAVAEICHTLQACVTQLALQAGIERAEQ